MTRSALTGVKVLDFSWALVGSITTKTLGDNGATIVKVESAGRPCLSRIDVQVAASSRESFDDKPWFAHLNTSKLSLRLDMKHKRAREVLEPLIAWADIVVENFSPGTMAKLGLGYEALRKVRPDIIMVSGSVYGQTGPLAEEWGVDGTGAALSGRLALTGWPDRSPVTPGAVPYGDVVLPYFMAAAAAAALEHRRKTGEGCHVDASMYEVCAQQMALAFAAAQRGAPLRRQGNRAPGIVQGVYPTQGEDRWIAISARDAEEWTGWTQRMGGAWPSWEAISAASEAELDAFDARIGAWTAPQEGFALMRALQAAGVPAGVVQDSEDLVERDPQIAHRGSLVSLSHTLLGPFQHIATPMRLSRTPIAMAPAPALGEHTDYICADIAGLDAAMIAELKAEGVFT